MTRFVPVLLVALSLGCSLDATSRYLVMIAALFLLGAVGEVIFARTQIPDVVWLILAGVGLNATGLVEPDNLDPILPLFSALTLIIVLFDGGRQIVIDDLIRAAPRASAMAFLSFGISTVGVAVILQLAALTGLLPESWTFLHSLMVGSILGGSSSLVIMPSMNLAKVDAKVSNLVGLESALTDALCVVVAVVLMDILASGDASGGAAALTLGENFGIALLVGLIAGWVWMPVLRSLSGNPYAYPVTLAALMFLYVIVDNAGGNSAMAVLTFSVIVGNAEALMKRVGFSLGDKPLALDDTVVTVHTQAAFFIKSFFFTYIGLKLSPPWSLLILGFLVGIALFVTRIPAVLVVARKGFDESERKMIAISLPRGMAAGVLATLPASKKFGIPGTEDLPALVFAAVVTSIGIFAYGFRKVRSGLPAAPPVPETAAETGTEVGPALEPGHVEQLEPPLPFGAPEALEAAVVDGSGSVPDTGSDPAASVDPNLMLDGRLSPVAPEPPASRSGTAYGLTPPPPEQAPLPAPAPSEARHPTAPGLALSTLHGLPAVQGGPPPPEARPGMGGLFTPKHPSGPSEARAPEAAPAPTAAPAPAPEPPRAERPVAPQWTPPAVAPAPPPVSPSASDDESS